MNFNKIQKMASPIFFLMLLFGIGISTYFYILTKEHIHSTNTKKFTNILESKTESIKDVLTQNIKLLELIGNVFLAKETISRKEFDLIVSTISNNKSINTISWIPRVSNSQRKTYEKNASKDLNIDFFFKEKNKKGVFLPSKIKEEYFPIYYIQATENNHKNLGFDLSSDKFFFKALTFSKRSKKITASSSFFLKQGNDLKKSFLIYSPVWQSKKQINLKGFISGVFIFDNMINYSLDFDKNTNKMLDIWIDDKSNNNELLYSNKKINTQLDSEFFTEISVGTRVWRVNAKPTKKFISEHDSNIPLISFLTMMFITILSTYIVSLKMLKTQALEKLIKKRTNALSLSNDKYESLLNMFDKNVIASRTNKKGIILYASSAFSAISAYSKEELLGKPYKMLRHPDMPKEFYINLWKTIKNGDIFVGEIKNKRKDGTSYWVGVTITPEFNDKNEIVSYFDIREDITAKKEIEHYNNTLSSKIDKAVTQNRKKDQLLMHQSKLAAMGEMLDAIAHQWRQPLNVLGMKMQFIESDYMDNLVDEKYLENYIFENMNLINFMSQTIDDFQTFSLKDKIKKEFSLKDKISETLKIISLQLEKLNIEVHRNDIDLKVIGFESEFKQVLLSIVNNAKDAFIEKKIKNARIEINLKKENDIIYLIISDNAGGINPDIINRVFDAYFTTKKEGSGTGLGLYMSKIIIEDRMNSKIYVENNGLGVDFILEFKHLG